jgi:hypothetical protein
VIEKGGNQKRRRSMATSRREFIRSGAAGAAVVGLAAAGCADAAPEKPKITMVGACGLSCQVCPLMKAGKCKGCGPGTSEMAAKKGCPVLKCASMKKLAYCGRDCPGFTKCKKIIGKPYAEEFIESMRKRMG